MEHLELEDRVPITQAFPHWRPPALPVYITFINNILLVTYLGDTTRKQSTTRKILSPDLFHPLPLHRTTSQHLVKSRKACVSSLRRAKSQQITRADKIFLESSSGAGHWNPWAQRLRRDQIRLCHIELDEHEELRVWLISFVRQKAPEYEALSYVCGPDVRDQEIILNTGHLRIGSNLFSALRQFKQFKTRNFNPQERWTDPISKPCVWLWVDAICINQDDPLEKAEQISQMHHTYREAQDVCVCLGTPSSEPEGITWLCQWLTRRVMTDRALSNFPSQSDLEKCLREVYGVEEASLELIYLLCSGEKDNLCFRGSEEDGCDLHLLPTNLDFWLSCVMFFEHEWHSRLWIYQEVALQDPFVLLHGTWTPWIVLRRIFFVLSDVIPKVPLVIAEPKMIAHRFHNLKNHILADNELWLWESKQNTLWDLLRLSTHRRVSDPRDHVFAILGLLDAEVRSRIVIDYSRAASSVFINAVEVAIQFEDGARQLPLFWEALSNIPHKTPGLPSWCPDFANESHQCGRFANKRKILAKDVSASCNHLEGLKITSSGKHIHLKLIILDRIASTSNKPSPYRGGDYHHGLNPASIGGHDVSIWIWLWLLKFSVTTAEMHSQQYEELATAETFQMPDWGDSLEEFLWYFILDFIGYLEDPVDQRIPSHPAEIDDEDIKRCLWKTFLKDRHHCLGLILLSCHILAVDQYDLASGGLTAEDDHGEEMGVSETLHSVIDFEMKTTQGSQTLHGHERDVVVRLLADIAAILSVMLEDQYVFRTVNGRYGHSPKMPSPGDHICFVPGGELLHIISADKSRYVAAASVHGLMDDDLFELIPDPETRFEEVTLY